MTWYADGSPCTYFDGFDEGGRHIAIEGLVAIGWLDGSHKYERGRVEPEFGTKLPEIVRSAWEPVVFMGLYLCELRPCRLLCTNQPGGYRNLVIPADGFAYASPELIVHYVSEHAYVPPEAFRAMVLACPRMSSDAYLDAMSENGPTQWLVSLELERISRHEPETEKEIFRHRDEWSRYLDEDEVESRLTDLILSTARRFHRR